MYEEEYFVGLLASNDKTAPPLIYKYFSNLTAQQLDKYETNQNPDSTNTLERGNILASSV